MDLPASIEDPNTHRQYIQNCIRMARWRDRGEHQLVDKTTISRRYWWNSNRWWTISEKRMEKTMIRLSPSISKNVTIRIWWIHSQNIKSRYEKPKNTQISLDFYMDDKIHIRAFHIDIRPRMKMYHRWIWKHEYNHTFTHTNVQYIYIYKNSTHIGPT